MINKTIPIIPDHDQDGLPDHTNIPGLARHLEHLFYLRLQGYSEEEAERMCKPKELSDEERNAILTAAIKENQKEVRLYNRILRKEAEERRLAEIFKKCG